MHYTDSSIAWEPDIHEFITGSAEL